MVPLRQSVNAKTFTPRKSWDSDPVVSWKLLAGRMIYLEGSGLAFTMRKAISSAECQRRSEPHETPGVVPPLCPPRHLPWLSYSHRKSGKQFQFC